VAADAWRGVAHAARVAKRPARWHVDAGRRHGGTAYAEQTIASVCRAVIAVMPILLVVINLAFGVYPRRSELIAVCVGLAGVVMLTQGAGIHGSPAGLLAIALATSGWALGSVLSQRMFTLAPGATGFASELLCGGVALLAMSAMRGESCTGLLSRVPGRHGCISWCLVR